MSEEPLEVGRYKEKPVYLTENGGNFYLIFGQKDSYHYWYEAIERILLTRPGYSFTTAEGLEVFVDELKPLILRLKDIMNSVS